MLLVLVLVLLLLLLVAAGCCCWLLLAAAGQWSGGGVFGDWLWVMVGILVVIMAASVIGQGMHKPVPSVIKFSASCIRNHNDVDPWRGGRAHTYIHENGDMHTCI